MYSSLSRPNIHAHTLLAAVIPYLSLRCRFTIESTLNSSTRAALGLIVANRHIVCFHYSNKPFLCFVCIIRFALALMQLIVSMPSTGYLMYY